VRDWRLSQLDKLPNVEIFLDSRLDAEQILEFGADRVALATGALWRRTGVGRCHPQPIPGHDRANVLSADDVMDGARPSGRVVIFDDDHYYMGAVLADVLCAAGSEVVLVTPGGEVAAWSSNTDEQASTQARLLEHGVQIETSTNLVSVSRDGVDLGCVFTGRTRALRADHVVMVTSREPNDELYRELCERIDITRVGDCSAPGIIAAAVFAGHRYAQEMDAPAGEAAFRRHEGPIRS
jgi:dimethylamine/trimethylamine dehydrogenase